MGSDLPTPHDYTSVQRTVILLVVAAVVITAGSATVGVASGASGVPAGGLEQMDVDPDDVLIEVSVDSDGDAVWEIQYRVRLATDEEEQAFEELRTDVESDPDAYTSRFRERMVSTANVAENATGREMAVTNTTVTAERRELPQSYGVLTYRFEWDNFAAVDDDRIVVGDAIDGMFLDETSSLIISWPDGYQLADASPSPTETREESVVWSGPIDFTDGEPRVSLTPDDSAAAPLLIGVIGLLVVVVAVIAYRRRPWTDTSPTGATGGSVTDDSASGTADGSGSERPDADARKEVEAGGGSVSRESAGEEELSAGADTSGAPEAGPEDSDVDAAAPVDEESLSNEEQVLRLIEANGGRMKQKRVAEELDWTAAKTSQVVTGLRDDDDLDGFRLGRENVLSLPDYDAESDGEADATATDDAEGADDVDDTDDTR